MSETSDNSENRDNLFPLPSDGESESAGLTDSDSSTGESESAGLTEPEQWRVMLHSVRGASHIRKKLPNQDYGDYQQQNKNGLPIILAISDGHGSPKSFRSDLGSKFAVETAITLLNGLVDQDSDRENLAAVKGYVDEKLKRDLVSQWKKAVEADLEKYQFTDKELDKLEQEKGRKACNEVEDNNFLAYGATLLAVLVTEDYNLYLQLGDGDILCVDTYGDITRPIRKDETLIANETYSLCMKDAWRSIEHSFVQYHKDKDNRPMILVATDGYANSFEEENFMKIGRDYLEMIRTEGCDEVEKQLEDILNQTSQGGSGDDITFGLIKRLDYKDIADKLKSLENKTKEQKKEQNKKNDEILDEIGLIRKGLKDSVKKNDVQEFVSLLTQISEASYSHLEKAVRAYTSSQQEWERRFVETTKAQYHKFEDLEQRLENLAKEESQNLKNIREEQKTEISKLKDNDDLTKQIKFLKKGLIATIILVVIGIGVNNIDLLIPKSSNINNISETTQ